MTSINSVNSDHTNQNRDINPSFDVLLFWYSWGVVDNNNKGHYVQNVKNLSQKDPRYDIQKCVITQLNDFWNNYSQMLHDYVTAQSFPNNLDSFIGSFIERIKSLPEEDKLNPKEDKLNISIRSLYDQLFSKMMICFEDVVGLVAIVYHNNSSFD